MRSTPFLGALVVSAGLGLASGVAAQNAAGPTIHRVTLQEDAGVLTITGTGLGPDLVVTVDGQPVAVLPGATRTQVEVLAPATVLTAPGTYRLTVADPVRQVGEAFVVAGPARSTNHSGSADPDGAPTAPTDATAAPAVRLAPGLVDRAAPRPGGGGVSPNLIETGSNTAVGVGALYYNTTGYSNTASGVAALYANTTGHDNTASGYAALYSNNGLYNTASGAWALHGNTTGLRNTASGSAALYSNTSGFRNTASGDEALRSNTTGYSNTANGSWALYSNSTGSYNVATGLEALYRNTAGHYNTASGWQALYSNTTGSLNTALGESAGLWGTVGSYNVFLGAEVTGTAADTNTIRLGLPYDTVSGRGQNQTFIAGIWGTQLTTWRHVVIDANGQLGTIDPQTGGGAPIPASATAPARTLEDAGDRLAAVAEVVHTQQQQLRDQQRLMRDQQITIGDLRARLARLEALLAPAASRK